MVNPAPPQTSIALLCFLSQSTSCRYPRIKYCGSPASVLSILRQVMPIIRGRKSATSRASSSKAHTVLIRYPHPVPPMHGTGHIVKADGIDRIGRRQGIGRNEKNIHGRPNSMAVMVEPSPRTRTPPRCGSIGWPMAPRVPAFPLSTRVAARTAATAEAEANSPINCR